MIGTEFMPTTVSLLARFAPALSLAVLLAGAMWLPTRVKDDPLAEQRMAQVRLAVEHVPTRIGAWNADTPKEIPREAQALLRPNAILNKVYVHDSSERPSVHLLLVHCRDTRDMVGHYPPICYPSSGFVPLALDGPDNESIVICGRPARVRVYGFVMRQQNGITNSMQIFSAFILPDGTVTGQIDDIYEQADRLAVSVRGVAQLQVILPADVAREDAVHAVNEVLAGMTDLFHSLGIPDDGERRGT
jgi:hypothetical protein